MLKTVLFSAILHRSADVPLPVPEICWYSKTKGDRGP